MSFLGVLMLDTRFPRPLGDIGHPGSFTMPVRHRVVRAASPERVVRRRAQGLLPAFVAEAQALVAEGARAITTSCGFLVLVQAELQAALPVPVWSSSLLQLPSLEAPGVVTAEASSLTEDHLRAAGAAPDTPVAGLPDGGPLQRTLLENLPTLDEAAARADTVAAAHALIERHPAVREIVLECTNLPPYADAVRAATGRPVHDILTFLHARWRALPT